MDNDKTQIEIGDLNLDNETKTSKINAKETLNVYDIFVRCIKRAENLVFFQNLSDQKGNLTDEHLCDSLRASIVLSISALDAFIRALVVSEIKKQLSNSKTKLNVRLLEYIKNLLNQDTLLDAARNYDLMEKVEKAVREDFETKSFQGEWKISSYLELVGYKDVFQEVSILANINEKNLRKNLTIYTTRRHIIAHSGDYNLNQFPPTENKICKEDAEECIKIVKLFAEKIHEIVSKNE